jgi:hypothetical protein
MRRFVVACIALAAVASSLGDPSGALAVDAQVRFNPSLRYTAWNATLMSVDVNVSNVNTSTTCPLDPMNPGGASGPCGLGGFEMHVTLDTMKLQFLSISPGPFLTATGRALTCESVVTSSGLTYICTTEGAVPLGPQGSGVLATISFRPVVSTYGSSTPLTFTRVTLADIEGAAIPAVGLAGVVQFSVCADAALPPSNTVDLQDTVAILGMFGQPIPPTDPRYDPNRDNSIDVADALLALQEFGQVCTYP